jgi:hypothetical protein
MGRNLVKSNKYFEFEEIMDLTDYVIDNSFLKKYGKAIEKSNNERKSYKKNAEIQKFENQNFYIDSSFKFFPPLKVTRKPNIKSNSSSSKINSLSKKISDNLKNRFSFLQGYWKSDENTYIKPQKIIYKLQSIIIHSGFFSISIINIYIN